MCDGGCDATLASRWRCDGDERVDDDDDVGHGDALIVDGCYDEV